eukprot:Opistho-1_new@63211
MPAPQLLIARPGRQRLDRRLSRLSGTRRSRLRAPARTQGQLTGDFCPRRLHLLRGEGERSGILVPATVNAQLGLAGLVEDIPLNFVSALSKPPALLEIDPCVVAGGVVADLKLAVLVEPDLAHDQIVHARRVLHPRVVLVPVLQAEVDRPHGVHLDALAPKLDPHLVALPEGVVGGFGMKRTDRRVVGHLLRDGLEPVLLPHQLVRLPQQRIKGLPHAALRRRKVRRRERGNVRETHDGIVRLRRDVQNVRVLEVLAQPLKERQRLVEHHRHRHLAEVLPDKLLQEAPHAHFRPVDRRRWKRRPVPVVRPQYGANGGNVDASRLRARQ